VCVWGGGGCQVRKDEDFECWWADFKKPREALQVFLSLCLSLSLSLSLSMFAFCAYVRAIDVHMCARSIAGAYACTHRKSIDTRMDQLHIDTRIDTHMHVQNTCACTCIETRIDIHMHVQKIIDKRREEAEAKARAEDEALTANAAQEDTEGAQRHSAGGQRAEGKAGERGEIGGAGLGEGQAGASSGVEGVGEIGFAWGGRGGNRAEKAGMEERNMGVVKGSREGGGGDVGLSVGGVGIGGTTAEGRSARTTAAAAKGDGLGSALGSVMSLKDKLAVAKAKKDRKSGMQCTNPRTLNLQPRTPNYEPLNPNRKNQKHQRVDVQCTFPVYI
jgi:hypothetical protein